MFISPWKRAEYAVLSSVWLEFLHYQCTSQNRSFAIDFPWEDEIDFKVGRLVTLGGIGSVISPKTVSLRRLDAAQLHPKSMRDFWFWLLA